MRRIVVHPSLLVLAGAATLGSSACGDAAADAGPIDDPASDAGSRMDGQDGATADRGERPRRDAAWLGGEDAGTPPNPGPLPELTAYASYWHSACAVGVDGSLWCWGNGIDWTLGWFHPNTIENPIRIGNATDWATVSVAGEAVCATRTNGSLWCWGSNVAALGIGGSERDSVIEPFQTGSDYDWKLVRVSWGYACGLKTNGELWCWGSNEAGQLGLGIADPPNYIAPVPMRVGPAHWKALSVSGDTFGNVCGVQVDGSLWCWGYGAFYEDFTDRRSPERVGTDSDWIDVEGGYDAFCALRKDRSLWCWGNNTYWQTGIEGEPWEWQLYEPRQVMPGTTWQSVRAGFWHACAIDTDSALWCWGSEGNGQLGNGSAGGQQLPTRIGVESDWSLYGGASPQQGALCAKRHDGSRWCWGDNRYGVFGDGTREDSLVPKRMP